MVARENTDNEIKIRHVKIMHTEEGDEGIVKLRGKTREREMHIAFSVPYVEHWLDVHPDRNNPDAPLWAAYKGPKRGGPRQLHYAETNRKIMRIIKVMAKDGFIFEESVTCHSFRHGRCFYVKSYEGLNDEQMRTVFGWVPGEQDAEPIRRGA